MRRLINSDNPDETAHKEPSHLDFHCLQTCVRIYLMSDFFRLYPIVIGNWPHPGRLPTQKDSHCSFTWLAKLLKFWVRFTRNKVIKGAKIRNRYNQLPHLTQDTNGKVTNSQLDTTNEGQEVSPFLAGDHKVVQKI